MDRKDSIKKISLQHGFDDARIAPWGEGSVLVLFARYAPALTTEADRICISSYYVASNRAYLNAAKLAEALCAFGIPAKRDAELPAKKAALACGGWIGKNGFYYHPAFGSLVHIQTLLLEEQFDSVPEPTAKGCAGCGACIAACPGGAVTNTGVEYSRCLRKHMNGTIPDDLKPHVYQLYGCEKCQLACPMNKPGETEGMAFDLKKTIQGETLPQLQELAGKNMARYVRTVNQAILCAANAGNTAVASAVSELSIDERFADACRYYLGRLKKKD